MQLLELVQTPDILRNEDWESQFLKVLTESNIKVMSADPQYGPDGWPYIMAEATADAEEPSQKVIMWLATRGMGLVINPSKEYPDYILTYGMIWSFKETGFFFKKVDAPSAGKIELNRKNIAHAGTPSPQYLPEYVRQILREFLRDQGVLAPKILVISQDNKNYDLAFSLESLGNPPESEWAGVAEAIGWFLPPHYSILLVSEKDMPEFSTL
jgi:hypothetical protein